MKAEIAKFIAENLPSFHQRRLDSLANLKLDVVLQRKNPYLFKAKNINSAGELVKGILDAHLSSQEETVFGAFLENVAIRACYIALGGSKSGIEGIDLEFTIADTRYIVTIKSGPKWANSSQLKKMHDNFRKAKVILRQNGAVKNVVAVNGCCYGRDNKPDKGDYFKYCGESFWTLISNDASLYLDLIEPLGHMAKQRNEEFQIEYDKATNRFTKLFIEEYCLSDGSVYWEKIVRLSSAKDKPAKPRLTNNKKGQ